MKKCLLLMLSILNLVHFRLETKDKKSKGIIKKSTLRADKPDQKRRRSTNKQKVEAAVLKISEEEKAKVDQDIKQGQVFDQLVDTEQEHQREEAKVKKQQSGLTSLFHEFQ